MEEETHRMEELPLQEKLLEMLVDVLSKMGLGMLGWMTFFFFYFQFRDKMDFLTGDWFTRKLTRMQGLHNAAEKDLVSRIAELLDAGADCNVRDKKGQTPLMVAADNISYGAALYLLSRGADPNLSDRDGNTALHLACAGADLSMICLLVGHGADITVRDEGGKTPEQIVRDLPEWVTDPGVKEMVLRYGLNVED